MKKYLLIATLALVAASPLHAQQQEVNRADKGDRQVTILAQATTIPVPSSAGTQTTVQTTAPVQSETTISVGTLAGQFLTWVAAAFSAVLGSLGSVWIFRALKFLGVQTTSQMQEQLQNIIVNGINAAAANVSSQLKDKGNVEVKNKVVADAVSYAQDHAADTIKALGLDPQSGAAVEAIKARIETALIDPATPTNNIVVPNALLPGDQAKGA